MSPSLFRSYITANRTKLPNSIKEGYLTVVNYRLFLKVKINPVIILASKTLFPKFLHQVWFTSFGADYAINPITVNMLNILL